MKKNEFPLVEVEWIDAGLESHQLGIEEAMQITPMARKNAGYLLVKDKEKVVLCAGFIRDRDKEQEVCDQALVIPRGCIKSINKLTT